MVLTLALKIETSLPIEVGGLTPNRLADKSLAQIEQVEIYHGNKKQPVAEIFDVLGDASTGQIKLHGDLTNVHGIGTKMHSGEIHVQGNAGRHLGSRMSGGKIVVSGNAGDWLGAEMRGGLIHVRGNAGHLVGAAYRGSPRGMTEGTILVDGNVGHEAGLLMRRGLIAIGGDAGNLVGSNMRAGTLLVFGACGQYPGAGMRRGTIGLFGAQMPVLLASFPLACTTRPTVLKLLLQQVRQLGFPFDENLSAAKYLQFNGDLVELGKGEVFIPENCC